MCVCVHVCRMGAPGEPPPLLSYNIILRSLVYIVMVVKELTSYKTCVHYLSVGIHKY